MHLHDCWSISIGRWLGVPVRLHAQLIVLLILVFAIEWNFVGIPETMGGIQSGTAVATSLAILLALLVHELAHAFTLTNLGGSVQQLILAPWGGRSEWTLPPSPKAKAVVHAAGIFANGMIFFLLAALLVNLHHARFAELVNPLHPYSLSGPTEIAFLRIFGWVNFQLFVLNLIPAAPLDGSQLLRLIVWSNNRSLSRHRLETSVMAIAHMVAVSCFVLAWFSYDLNEGPIQPTWALLALFGLALIFASRHEFFRQMEEFRRSKTPPPHSAEDYEDLAGLYDEGAHDVFEFEEDQSESISQWLKQKMEERHRVEYEIEKEEERRVDGILEKLHRSGRESLTDEERTILQRVSDRYRRRRRQLPS